MKREMKGVEQRKEEKSVYCCAIETIFVMFDFLSSKMIVVSLSAVPENISVVISFTTYPTLFFHLPFPPFRYWNTSVPNLTIIAVRSYYHIILMIT